MAFDIARRDLTSSCCLLGMCYMPQAFAWCGGGGPGTMLRAGPAEDWLSSVWLDRGSARVEVGGRGRRGGRWVLLGIGCLLLLRLGLRLDFCQDFCRQTAEKDLR